MYWSQQKIGKLLILAALFSGWIFLVSAAQAANMTPEAVADLVNQARLQAQLAPLVMNAQLTEAAASKAADMLAKNYFAHTSPQGQTPWSWLTKSGYSYTYAGENLAMGFTDAAQQQKAWMDSAEHRKNILQGKYQEIGVAIRQGVLDGEKITLTVQEFGARADFVAPSPKITDRAQLISSNQSVAGAASATVLSAMPKSGAKIDWLDSLEAAAIVLFCVTVGANALILLTLSFDSLECVYKHRRQLLAK